MAELDDQYWLEKAARVNHAGESLQPDLISLQGLNNDMGAALDGPQPAFDPLDPRLTRAPQLLGLAQPAPPQGGFPFNDLPPDNAPMWTKVLAGAGGALEALSAGYHGRTPLFLQMQQQGLQKQQLNEQIAVRKAQMAQHLHEQQAKLTEAHDKDAIGIWSNPTLSIAMKKKASEIAGAKGNTLAMNLARLGDGEIAAKLDVVKPYLPPGKYQELYTQMHQPNADLAPVEHWLQFGEERHKATIKDDAERAQAQSALDQFNQDPSSMNDTDLEQVKKFVANREKRDLEIAELKAKLRGTQLDVQAK